MAEWYYRSESIVGTAETVGPMDDQRLLKLAMQGVIKRDTLLFSSTTSGQWYPASAFAAVLKAIEQGDTLRQQEREAQAAEKKRQAQLLAEERARQQSERQAAAISTANQLSQISHCQNVALVQSLVNRVKAILTNQEAIAYVAVQQKPLVNMFPDAVVATNRRLIFYRAKMLGRYDFQDFQLFDLCDAHIQQNLLGSVFSARHVSGQSVSMDYLPREASESLYRLVQESEEKARWARHNMHLDTLRAAATNVNVQANAAAPAPNPQPAGNDLMARLQKLKAMVDQGLITADDYDRRKAEILKEL